MTADRILWVYRLTFVSLIIVASVQTLMPAWAGHELPVVVLASVEIAGATALAWRRTQVIGAGLLLLVFAAAQVFSVASGEWPTRFLIFAASTLLIVLLDARRAR